MSAMTPQEIVSELDRFIIGQQAAKRAVAIALRNRWRRQRVDDKLRPEITPKNILMIGPTGVGKTEIARRLARLADAPFIKVEATKFTEVGYVGKDVDSIVRDLVEMAVKQTRESDMRKQRMRAEDAAEERILDVLLPPPRGTSGEPQPNPDSTARQAFRKKLREGQLDDRDIEIDLAETAPAMQVMGPAGMEEMAEQLRGMFSQMGQERRRKRKLKIGEAMKLLIDEEAGKLVNEEDVRSMGLAAGGVGGMKLKKNDEIVYASVVEPTGELLTMTEQGYTKRSSLEEYSTQGRNGGGIVTHKPTSRTGPVVAALMLPGRALVQAADEWLTVTLSKGTPSALTIDEIPQMGRGVQGKQVVAAGMGIAVENITHLQMPEETHAPNGGAPEDEPELGRNGAASKKTETAVRTTAQARAKRKSAALKSATSKSAKPKGGVAARKTTTAAKASSSATASQSSRAAKHNKNKSSDKATTNQSTTNKSTQNKSTSNKSTANASTAKAKQPSAKAVATKKIAAKSTAAAASSQTAASSGAAKQKSVTTKTNGSKRKTVDSTAQLTPKPTRKKATTPKATAQSKANSSSSKKTKAVEKKATTSRKSTVATKAAPAQTSQSATPKTGNTKTASAKTSNPKASSAKASRPKTDDTQLDGGRKKAKSTGARKTSATKTAHSAAAAKGNATSATAKGNKNSAAKSTAPSTPSTKSKAAATPKAAATKRRAGKAPKVAVVASVTKSQANQAKDSAQKR